MPVHPEAQRLETAQDQQHLECRDAGAVQLLDAGNTELIDQLFARHDGAGQKIAMPAQVFRR